MVNFFYKAGTCVCLSKGTPMTDPTHNFTLSTSSHEVAWETAQSALIKKLQRETFWESASLMMNVPKVMQRQTDTIFLLIAKWDCLEIQIKLSQYILESLFLCEIGTFCFNWNIVSAQRRGGRQCNWGCYKQQSWFNSNSLTIDWLGPMSCWSMKINFNT